MAVQSCGGVAGAQRLSWRRLAPALLSAWLAACGEPTKPPDPVGARLTVSITGLPGTVAAAVTVTGDGFNTAVTHTRTLTGLAPGSYTIAAGQVQSPGAWYPAATSQVVLLGTGDVTAHVRYSPLPASGHHVPALDLFDSALVAFMMARSIPSGTLTISVAGSLRYSRAFGWKDAARTQPLSPDAMFRLASVSKPVTNAAIRKLVAGGAISLSTKAFAYLGLQASGAVADARIHDVTVQHLLDHAGGWDREMAGDFVFSSRQIARDLGLDGPPNKTQVAQWAMTRPLQFAPGARTAYSNFGYSLLGLIVEKASGMPYIDYVRQHVFSPAAADRVIAGRSLPADRDPREPHYSDPYRGCSVFVISTCILVPWHDGGWYLEAFDSFGGLVASGPAIASFLESYWISGHPRVSTTGQHWYFYGTLDGTYTLARQRSDGVILVALFNQRTDPSGLSYDDIRPILDGVSQRITAWPAPLGSLAAAADARRAPGACLPWSGPGGRPAGRLAAYC